MKHIAIIGGGINGVMTAWSLASRGHKVELFERKALISATSAASTKLLHGGLRYLEHGQFSLVREGLLERSWWIRQAPHLAWVVPIILPVYKGARHSSWKVNIGLFIYDKLAGALGLGRHKKLSVNEILKLVPELNQSNLQGGFVFYDGQMDDYALGLWASEQARNAGVLIRENVFVEKVFTTGELMLDGKTLAFDLVYNVCGPWAEDLLLRSGIKSDLGLVLVRGSHIVLDCTISSGLIVEVPGEDRVVFILPYKGHTLIGTTEVVQDLTDEVRCSEEEEVYLLGVYNHYIAKKVTSKNVIGRYAGLRPLIHSHKDPGDISREYSFEKAGNLVTVFGGKWTTSRSLAEKAAAFAD